MSATVIWLLMATFTAYSTSTWTQPDGTSGITSESFIQSDVTLGEYFTEQDCLADVANWRDTGIGDVGSLNGTKAISNIGPCRKTTR